MNISALGKAACIFLLSAFSFISNPIHAAIVETGDLNCIDETGNVSDGLCFLDMTYSDGLSKSDALANAQGTYANARLATPQEWDDLFSAAGVIYQDSRVASDAFTFGRAFMQSRPFDQGVSTLRHALGPTLDANTLIWSDPDDSLSGTRDWLTLYEGDYWNVQNWVNFPPHDGFGWLIVSGDAVVPIPAAGWLFISALVGLIGKNRLSSR